MYTLTITTITPEDRTEENYYFATASDAYARLAEVVTGITHAPPIGSMTFSVRPMKGSLPIDAQIGGL